MPQPWTCAVCGAANDDERAAREEMFCSDCRSTWRIRCVALATMHGLGLPLRPLAHQQPDWSRRGVGISDHLSLVAALTPKFDYVNTYYHRFPRLDLLDIPDDLRGELEFVLCSDVLEHVPPPADIALRGLAGLLRRGGFAVISVPVRGGPDTSEYYPDLRSWHVRDDGAVVWTDEGGHEHVDDDPEFHGGPGQTLAFRLWSGEDLVDRLVRAGFETVMPCPSSAELGVPELEHQGMFLARR